MKRLSMPAFLLMLGSVLMTSASVMAAKATRDTEVDLPFGERSIMSERAIRERTAPPGAVCLEGDACGSGLVVADAAQSGAARTTESIYQSYCMACHANAVGGAPKTHDKAAWAGRANLASAINGIGIMPARGGCADCTDAELQAVIDFMSNE